MQGDDRMMERDARTLALKTEEAALLPAMNHQRMTGGSALASVLQKTKPAMQNGGRMENASSGRKRFLGEVFATRCRNA